MRDEIVKYLGTVAHSTAKTLSDRIGVDRLEIARELNAMHAEAIVEREKRGGGGNEYVYWLSRKDDVAMLEAAVGAPTLPAVRNEPPPMPSVVPAKADIDATEQELRKQVGELMGTASTLTAKLTEAEVERDDLKAKVYDLTRTAANRQDKIAALEQKVEQCRNDLAALGKERDALNAELHGAHYTCEQLREQITTLSAQMAAHLPPVGKSVADALRPFLVDGQKIIWREPFRWHDDRGVMSNHYEGMTLEALAEAFGYEVVIDCQLAAIIKPRNREPHDRESNMAGTAEAGARESV
ncbi:hypothetical protein [Paraburkholderia sacchari]|uniref:hypothetical protein n=1 Tax=Paraburkholderia sacchari TaxID=159450 RepID=UPI001BCF090C|nr:hypothetical protein [Paraburkholderia sacchari]